MKFQKLTLLILLVLLIVFISNLLYFPGPDFLHNFSILAYNAFTLLSVLLVLTIPISIIWLIVRFNKKRKYVFPLLLICVSIFGYLNSARITFYFRSYAREYTIKESAKIINSIDTYKSEHNEYPNNLLSLIPEYIDAVPNPKIIGIHELFYKKTDTLYELEFHQSIVPYFNFEVVIYNPHGEQKGRGEMPELQETSHKNWKYFIFD